MNESEIRLTDDESLMLDKDFHKINSALLTLCNSGMIHRMAGNCISAAELISGLLNQLNIDSSIVECQLTMSRFKSDGKPEFFFIGFDNLGLQGELDTHVIVVTKTKTPFLIDVSISQYLPKSRPIIIGIAKLTTTENSIAEIAFKDYKLIYTQKHNIKLPSLHQKNILQKIAEDNKIKKDISLLRTIVTVIATFSLINFTLNTIQVILKVMNP